MVYIKPSKDAPRNMKDEKPLYVAHATAVEHVRLSGGQYEIVQPKDAVAKAEPLLEDMDREQLLGLAISLGMKTQKQMRHSEIVAFVRKRMDDIEIMDDEG